jgi:hypothetical protein
MSVPKLSETAAQAIVQRAARATGADFSFLLETAGRESGLAPAAQAKTSSAAGLFQFIESTWLRLVERYGEKHGLPGAEGLGPGDADRLGPKARRALLDLRFDPQAAATLAGELAQENAAVLEARLGRPAQAGELYAAHVLGPAGAARLIEAADAQAPAAATLFPAAAKANPALFFDREGAAVSAQALLTRLAGAGAPAGKGGEAQPEAPAPAAPFEALDGALWAALLGLEPADDPHSQAETERRARRAYALGGGTGDKIS